MKIKFPHQIVFFAFGCFVSTCTPAFSTEKLPNGIQLPEQWPPRYQTPGVFPSSVPYLLNPPATIPIDLGRQLFVDDFLIATTTLRRVWHKTQPYNGNPVLQPDRTWEKKVAHIDTLTGKFKIHAQLSPTARVYSDGVWYDSENHIFKMWYMCGFMSNTCMAESIDGLNWNKPNFDVVKNSNIVLPGHRDSATVLLDEEDLDKSARFKLFLVGNDALNSNSHEIYVSSDGIHWRFRQSGLFSQGDRSTVFYNPFRKVWVLSARSYLGAERIRKYVEYKDRTFERKKGDWNWWLRADNQDNFDSKSADRAQIYNLDAFPYENLTVGLVTILRGQQENRPKMNDVLVMFSRDGFYWDRSNRTPFIPMSEHEGEWNWGNVQSAGGGCVVVGEKLYFYHSGRAGIKNTIYSGKTSTGVAFLRRDGFAGMVSSRSAGALLTRPVQFSGHYLFVNCSTGNGELAVEVLGKDGKVIPGYSKAHCIPIVKDGTILAVHWVNQSSLESIAGQTVQFKFYLRHGELFSFWVSPSANGESGGYIAAGGPGYNGLRDTQGIKALNTVRKRRLKKK